MSFHIDISGDIYIPFDWKYQVKSSVIVILLSPRIINDKSCKTVAKYMPKL